MKYGPPFYIRQERLSGRGRSPRGATKWSLDLHKEQDTIYARNEEECIRLYWWCLRMDTRKAGCF